MVTVGSPVDAVAVNAAQLTAIMVAPMSGVTGLQELLADRRKNAVVLGPGLGVGEQAIAQVAAVMASHAAVVVDADGLTSFSGGSDALFAPIRDRRGAVVLTPHDGEFRRLFPDLVPVSSKLERAREAARRSGAVVVAKGPDTVVAAPTGIAAISDNAPPELATAGAGDVLAGLIGGLLAQRMTAFEAAAAAVWLHGDAANRVGRGLIAEDLPEVLPEVLVDLVG